MFFFDGFLFTFPLLPPHFFVLSLLLDFPASFFFLSLLGVTSGFSTSILSTSHFSFRFLFQAAVAFTSSLSTILFHLFNLLRFLLLVFLSSFSLLSYSSFKISNSPYVSYFPCPGFVRFFCRIILTYLSLCLFFIFSFYFILLLIFSLRLLLLLSFLVPLCFPQRFQTKRRS